MNTSEEILIQSRGWQAVNRIGTLNEMYYILIENYRELMYEILRIQDSSQPIIELVENKKLTRYIFNFLASTSASTDHCRKVMHFYENTDLNNKYKNKINNLFVNNPMIVFIQNLRNYQMHFKLEFLELSNSDQVVFLTQKLLQHPEQWNKLSRDYMQQCGDEIVLKTLCEDYFKLLESFYMWLYSELKEFHKEDLIERKQLAAECGVHIIDI